MKSKSSKPTKSRSAQTSRDNRANQLNRNNDAFWQSRGQPARPADWKTTPSTLRPRSPSKKSR